MPMGGDPIYFYKTTPDEAGAGRTRVRNLRHKTSASSPAVYQKWTGYSDSIDLSSSYPYQTIYDTPSGDPLLIFSTSPLYFIFDLSIEGWKIGLQSNRADWGIPPIENDPYDPDAFTYYRRLTDGDWGSPVRILNDVGMQCTFAYFIESNTDITHWGTTIEVSKTTTPEQDGNETSVSSEVRARGVYYKITGGSSVVIPSTPSLLHTLNNPSTYGTNDRFGWSIDTSDSFTVVGIYEEVINSNSGKAYVYNNNSGELLYTLSNPNSYGTYQNDLFGRSVAICEEYIVVGAEGEDSLGASNSGAVYVFETSTGNLIYTLTNPNAYGTATNDAFGRSVAVSSGYIVVGTPLEDDTGGNSSGKIYVYGTSNGLLLYTIDNPNVYGTSGGDNFGKQIDICDFYIIAGCPFEDVDLSGVAYIFNIENGTLLHALINPNTYGTSYYDQFGISVSICDTYAIVGASQEDDGAGSSSGKAYVYNSDTGELLYILNNPNAYGGSLLDEFGHSVSISEQYAIIGSYNEDDELGDSSGKAYIYSMQTGELLYTLNNPNSYGVASTADQFGWEVSTCQSCFVVSAPFDGGLSGANSGTVYIFGQDSATSEFIGRVNI